MDGYAETELPLAGRTIVRATIEQSTEDPGWTYMGGDITIEFDDGTILTTSCIGHDAWSNDVTIKAPDGSVVAYGPTNWKR